MTRDDDRMPVAESYRGVDIHAFQPRERIEGEIRPAIDAVYGLADPERLAAYVADHAHPPEARILAAARCEALWELAAESREVRPRIDRTMLHAHTAGLDSLGWASPWYYGTILDPGPAPGDPRPEPREAGCAAELEAAQEAQRERERRRPAA